jgi:hypothetical protein
MPSASQVAQLRRDLDALEKLNADIGDVARRNDDERLRELIALRRKLAEQIAVVGQLGDAIFVQRGDDTLLRTYRSGFSRMRSAVALHQANWPAVMLGERPDEYRASAVTARDASREFIEWARRTLDSLPRE